MALFFGVMYLYCWLPEYLGPYRERRRAKKEQEKEELRKKRRESIIQSRDDQNKVLQSHSDRVQKHREWLDNMNDHIKERFNLEDWNNHTT